jgi:hypothetical protein
VASYCSYSVQEPPSSCQTIHLELTIPATGSWRDIPWPELGEPTANNVLTHTHSTDKFTCTWHSGSRVLLRFITSAASLSVSRR